MKCLAINSIYKKPSHFYFDVYHIKDTDQLVVEGMVYPHGKDEEAFEVFHLIDHAPLLTLKALIVDELELVEDASDITLHDEGMAMLEKKVITMQNQSVWIVN